MNLGIASCRSFYFSDSWKASYFDLIRFMMSLHLPSGRWVWSVTWCETGQLEPGHLAPVPNQGSEKGEATCAASGSRRRSMHDSQATVVGDSLCCSLIFFFSTNILCSLLLPTFPWHWVRWETQSPGFVFQKPNTQETRFEGEAEPWRTSEDSN